MKFRIEVLNSKGQLIFALTVDAEDSDEALTTFTQRHVYVKEVK